MKKVLLAFGGLFVFVVLMFGCYVLNWAGKAADVVAHEVDPAVLQQKYEWFKNAAAQLDSKLATLKTYQSKLSRLRKLDDENKLDRTNREQLMTWEQEQQGVKASYNDLAAEYNSQMTKWNWKFTNAGELRYHQHYLTGGQIIHISSQPIPIKSVTINLEAVDQK